MVKHHLSQSHPLPRLPTHLLTLLSSFFLPSSSFPSVLSLDHFPFPDFIYSRFGTSRTIESSWTVDNMLQKIPGDASVKSNCTSKEVSGSRGPENHILVGIWIWVRSKLSFWADDIQSLSLQPSDMFQNLYCTFLKGLLMQGATSLNAGLDISHPSPYPRAAAEEHGSELGWPDTTSQNSS
jgi:hypothetical protein